MKAICCCEAWISIGTFHKFVAEPGTPLRCRGRGLRKRLEAEVARVLAANHNRESVIETERRLDCELKTSRVFIANTREHGSAVAHRRLFQNCGQSRARVFDVRVDP